MKINRELLQQKLLSYSLSGSGLIVGSPGVGKTYSVLQLTRDLKEKDIPYIIIPVDRLGNATPNDISAAFKISETLSEKLKKTHFNPKNPGIVLVDGFDAARSLEGQDNLIALIKELLATLKGGWNILVSVRLFDARKSRELLKLFPDNKIYSEELFQNSSIACRHFFVPPLTEAEITALDWQIEGLKDLYLQGSSELKEILSIPFNLWMLEGLKKSNKERDDLKSINSESELLRLFWTEYVSSGSQSENKEHILRSLTKTMVETYTLSTNKDSVYSPVVVDAWKELFSSEILVESNFSGQKISFSHNILFDFAVSILQIDESAEKLIAFMVQDPARALFLRPSLTYFYERLWFYNKNLFWESFWIILSNQNTNLRLFARLVPSAVIAKHASKIQDFDNLLNPPKQYEEIATDSIVRIFQAHDFLDNTRDEVWLNLCDKLSLNIKKDFLWLLARLTGQILEKSLSDEKSEQIDSCGVIGRRIFTWMWNERDKGNILKNWLDGIGADLVLKIVIKSYFSNTAESKLVVDNILGLVKEKNFPISYLYRLTDYISHIWPYHPEQVEAIYRTLFSYQENSKEVTSFGTPVLPLLSNRKQDFDMCHYKLIKNFPAFLNAKPLNATKAAIDCIDAYAWQKQILRYAVKDIKLEEVIKKFSFRGVQASYLPDNSCIWDSPGGHKDEPLKMADSLFNYLEKNKDNRAIVDSILDVFANRAITAFWWKRLLMFGEQNIEFFHEELFPLCLSELIVDGIDTEFYAVNFIEDAWGYYTTAQKLQIENAVMSIDSDDENKKKYITKLKEKIIGRIPKEHLTRQDSIGMKQSLESRGEPPSNDVPYKIETGWRNYSEDDDLKERGINIAEPEIALLKQLWKPLAEMSAASLNGVPNEELATTFISNMRSLHSALMVSKVTEKIIIDQGWTELSRAAAIVARTKLDFNSADYKFIEQILLFCSKHSSPEPYPDADKTYRMAHYSQAPRTEAAQGLCWLSRLGESPAVQEALRRLSNDPAPSVRYLTLREIWRGKDISPDFVWDTLESRTKVEENYVVLGAITYSIGYFLVIDEGRAVVVVDILLSKLSTDDERSENSKTVLDILIWLFIEKNNNWAIGKINDICSSPSKYRNLIYQVVHKFLGYLISKNLEKKEQLFERAASQIAIIVQNLWRDIGVVYSKSTDKMSDEDKKLLKDLYAPIDDIITRIYFAADVDSDLREGKVAVLTDAQRGKYFLKVKGILQLVLDESLKSKGGALFAPTAHYFMQLLNGVLQYDVGAVLKMAADLNTFSEGTGYVGDSMAIEQVVALTEEILADHRSYLRKSENIENLLRLLDTFAKTGWTEALRLVWRLDEIYR